MNYLQEIDSLRATVTELVSKVGELQKKNSDHQNNINVLNNIIIKYEDICANFTVDIDNLKKKNTMQDKYILRLAKLQEDVSGNNVDMYDNLKSVIDIVESSIDYNTNDYDKKYMIAITDNDSVSERSSEANISPLTKKQKINKKKHERRKTKRLEQQQIQLDIQNKIVDAREQWNKENGYNPHYMGLEFI